MERFRSLPNNILVHDLSDGIPFPDGSVDVVYHSHVLEHLDRDVAAIFIGECKRVLRPGGILRVVVPDYEKYCLAYLQHVEMCVRSREAWHVHDQYFEPLLEMSVRREAYGSSKQSPIRRQIENVVLGDARSRGETHQWMYDRFNLSWLLLSTGFVEPRVFDFNHSLVAEWDDYGLDRDSDGLEYKPGSLYVEALKP